MTAAVLAATALTSTAASMYEQREAGKAQQKMYNLQAQEQMKQAELETQRAGMEQENAEIAAQERRRQLSQDIGSIYAQAAGNGVLIDSGSVQSIAEANRMEANADVNNLLRKQNLAIWGHNQNSGAYARQASLSKFQGRAAKASTGNLLNAGISAVGGAASGFSSGMQLGGAINNRYGTSIF